MGGGRIMGKCDGYNLGSKSHLQGKLIFQCQIQITYNTRVCQTLINSSVAWSWFVVKKKKNTDFFPLLSPPSSRTKFIWLGFSHFIKFSLFIKYSFSL